MFSWLLVATFLLGTAEFRAVDACSMPVGWRPPTMEELIGRASEVLFAGVRRTFPDVSGRPWSRYLYIAEVDVFCIMKGQRTPAVVNITDVGLFPVDMSRVECSPRNCRRR